MEAVTPQWTSSRGRRAARRLGNRVGAGLVLTASIVASGPDSIAVEATLHDVAARRVLHELKVYGSRDRLDRVANDLALAVLTAVAADRPLGAWRLSSLGSASATAVKAFLKGEYHLRRFQLDSARSAYQDAIAIDSTYALAYRGLSETGTWLDQILGYDPEPAFRAAALNHGLARRESLLIVVDSVEAALTLPGGPARRDSLFRQLYSATETAVASYPTDPEVWFRSGDALFHWGRSAPHREEENGRALTRALELDPSFAPPLIHLIELAFMRPDEDTARRRIEEFLSLPSSGPWTDAARLVADLLSPAPARRAAAARQLDSLATNARPALPRRHTDDDATFTLLIAAHLADRGVDSLEVALRVFRRWKWAPGHAMAAAFRGHLREAVGVWWVNQPPAVPWPCDPSVLLARLALVGGFPPETADSVFAAMLARGDTSVLRALPWWAERGDSTALRRAVVVLEDSPDRTGAARARYAREAVRGYLRIMSGDTVAGAEVLGALRPWCDGYACYQEQFAAARALARAGQSRAAAVVFDRLAVPRDRMLPPDFPLVMLEHARLQERLGEIDRAIPLYRYVAAAWRHADLLLQPFVTEARDAVVRLSAETPPATPRPR